MIVLVLVLIPVVAVVLVIVSFLSVGKAYGDQTSGEDQDWPVPSPVDPSADADFVQRPVPSGCRSK